MDLGQCILNTVLLNLWQLCEIDEEQYNMGRLFQQHLFMLLLENDLQIST